MSDEKRTIEVNWVQASAGALAAMSSAVLLSTVGVAGTVIGAALGSVIATVGSAVYSHYLRASRERIAESHAAALARVSRARASVSGAASDVGRRRGRAEQQLDQADQELRQAGEELRDLDGPAGVSWRTVLVGLPWKRILLAAVGLFVAVMLVILAFELLTGRAVSTYTGGTDNHTTRTSLPGILGGGSGKPADTLLPSDQPTPSPSVPTPTLPAPSEEPSLPTPTATTEAPILPSATVSPEPTGPAPTAPEPSSPVSPVG